MKTLKFYFSGPLNQTWANEESSALCAVSKVVKIFQTRKIHGKLKYEKPNPAIKVLKDGQIIPINFRCYIIQR